MQAFVLALCIAFMGFAGRGELTKEAGAPDHCHYPEWHDHG